MAVTTQVQFRRAYRLARIVFHGGDGARAAVAALCAMPLAAVALGSRARRYDSARYNGVQAWPAITRRGAVNNALRCAQIRRYGFARTPRLSA